MNVQMENVLPSRQAVGLEKRHTGGIQTRQKQSGDPMNSGRHLLEVPYRDIPDVAGVVTRDDESVAGCSLGCVEE